MPLTLAEPAAAVDGPPVAPIHDVTETHFGTTVHDPYRYMEDLKDSQVQAWIKAQADYAASQLGSIKGRDALLARIAELDESAPFRIFGVRRLPDGGMYYFKQLASDNLAKFYFRASMDAPEKLLVDPENFKSGNKHASLESVEPSPDRKYIVFGIALSGSEQTILHVMDVSTGSILAESIDRIETAYTSPQWLPDSSGFVYERRRDLPKDAPPTEGYKFTRTYLHKLHADVSADREVFGKGSSINVPMDDTDFPSIVIDRGCQFAIGKIKHGDANEITLYSAPLSQLAGGTIEWKKICDANDAVTDFAVHDGWIYLTTHKDAPRYKVVRTSLRDPGFAAAETVVPPGQYVVSNISSAKDALYVTLMDGGVNSVHRIEYSSGAAMSALAAPNEHASFSVSSASNEVDGVLLHTSSWTRGGETLSFNPAGAKYTVMKLEPRGKFDDPEGLDSVEVKVKSHDGVMVPLSIIFQKGIKLDGSHPTLLSGYGAYGFSQHIYYSAQNLAWLERGGVLAIAHVRGGGEYGKEWHLAGQKLTKPNTWKDFNACAQYLIDQKYTSPQKLAGQAGSAGGILIGRAITERPDLYAAAIISVGCTDAIRMETTTNGVPNIQEFGTVTDPDGFKGLLEMSAYAHVVEGTKYPAVLLVHGINDPRVEPWMSAKMTARLQAATTSGKPVLFRVDYDAGHGIGSTRKQRQQLTADEWAFLLWQFGDLN